MQIETFNLKIIKIIYFLEYLRTKYLLINKVLGDNETEIASGVD